MSQGIKSTKVRISGMTCVHCKSKIERQLRDTAGIQSAKVDYGAGIADVAYDTDIISCPEIAAVIENLDYKVLTEKESGHSGASRAIGLLMVIAALFILLQQFGLLNLLAPSLLAETSMGYGMLFVIGLITSVHCVAMCGGINLSQCVPQQTQSEGAEKLAALRPALLYNLGRVISYTAVGFIVGAIGSVITFSNGTQGALKLIAGVFMVIMGLNMLGIFPWFRKLAPRAPAVFARKIDAEKRKRKHQLVVGLLNGLMPCGPLQAVQIYALSTGNPFAGALSMFLFSMGTVPLMFGLGALSTVLSKKYTGRVMTAGAALVVALGLSMCSQGWLLSGFALPGVLAQGVAAQTAEPDAEVESGAQVVYSTLSAWEYPTITVQAGTPVKWVIDAPQGSVNGCNNRMLIQEYGIEYTFEVGENIIEFMPEKSGTFQYSCWMGMIDGAIHVVEPGTEAPATNPIADVLSGANASQPTSNPQTVLGPGGCSCCY